MQLLQRDERLAALAEECGRLLLRLRRARVLVRVVLEGLRTYVSK